MKHLRTALALISLLLLPQLAAAKDVLVLLPVQVDNHTQSEASLFGTALQQGLNEHFQVFFGAAVEEKLEIEVAKEDCTAESCAQNLAIAFNGELICDASIQRLTDSYVVQLQINNIVTGRNLTSLVEVCEDCSKISLIRFLKDIGARVAQQNAGGEATADSTRALRQDGKQLEINTNSFDTVISINGEKAGRSPLKTKKRYSPGETVSILLQTPGYDDLRITHIVGENDQRLRNISLVKDVVELQVTSQPSDSAVYFDGQLLGRTPLRSQGWEVGQIVEIEVKKTGFDPVSFSHRIGENDARLQNLRLSETKRRIYIGSQPRGFLYIDNRLVGETPREIGPFKEGERIKLRIERNGYDTISLRHRVGVADESLRTLRFTAADKTRAGTAPPPQPSRKKTARPRMPIGF